MEWEQNGCSGLISTSGGSSGEDGGNGSVSNSFEPREKEGKEKW